MSKIEVDQVDPQSGTTLTLGTSGDTISIPAGVTLSNSGTATGFASIAWQSSIVTGSTLTAVAGNGYWIDTTSNACTITLPASASAGDQIILVDYARTWGTNAVTIDQNSLNYQGFSSPNPVYDTNGETVSIVYSGATQGWIPVDDGAVALETPQGYDIDFLVIAGGGAGGDAGGGGGAGGYRTTTQFSDVGTVITITVGDGGVASNGSLSTSGSDSSISGSGLTTITSAGGGFGGNALYPVFPNSPGGNGGSGGGGGGDGETTPNLNPGGSGNTPSTSPSQGNGGGIGSGNPSNRSGGGGGGASAVGANGSTNGTTGGNGGAGTASSITGSSVTRAGGGGGYNQQPGTAGTGGTGGGGNGGSDNPSTAGTNGTANTGGGGGGSSAAVSGNGGKGVVILSMPDAKYSGTTTGSPTVATGVSGKTVLTFTGSGSYTA
jgi:hypothetical protein